MKAPFQLLLLLLLAPAALALSPTKELTQYALSTWQIRDGYLWVGTQEGLARFRNGYIESLAQGEGPVAS